MATPPAPLIVIYGATGPTGVPLVTKALSSGLRVRAFVRDPAKLSANLTSNPNLELFKGDLTDLDAVERALDGATFAACVAGGRPLCVTAGLHNTVKTVLDAMPEKGVTRFLYQAAAFTPTPGQKLPMGMKIVRGLIATLFRSRSIVKDHDAAVEELTKNEGVQWVVSRPGKLSEGKSRGTLVECETPGAAVMYEDVAAFNLQILQSDRYNHKCIYPTYAS